MTAVPVVIPDKNSAARALAAFRACNLSVFTGEMAARAPGKALASPPPWASVPKRSVGLRKLISAREVMRPGWSSRDLLPALRRTGARQRYETRLRFVRCPLSL